jgi:hypothetical protein
MGTLLPEQVHVEVQVEREFKLIKVMADGEVSKLIFAAVTPLARGLAYIVSAGGIPNHPDSFPAIDSLFCRKGINYD